MHLSAGVLLEQVYAAAEGIANSSQSEDCSGKLIATQN
jgi:hypothetical protein